MNKTIRINYVYLTIDEMLRSEKIFHQSAFYFLIIERIQLEYPTLKTSDLEQDLWISNDNYWIFLSLFKTQHTEWVISSFINKNANNTRKKFNLFYYTIILAVVITYTLDQIVAHQYRYSRCLNKQKKSNTMHFDLSPANPVPSI